MAGMTPSIIDRGPGIPDWEHGSLPSTEESLPALFSSAHAHVQEMTCKEEERGLPNNMAGMTPSIIDRGPGIPDWEPGSLPSTDESLPALFPSAHAHVQGMSCREEEPGFPSSMVGMTPSIIDRGTGIPD